MLDKNINVRVDKQMEWLIRRAARAQGRTISNYVRHVVARAVIIDLASEPMVDHDSEDKDA